MAYLQRLVQTLTAWVLPRPLLVLFMAFSLAGGSLAITIAWLGLQDDQLELIASDHPLIALNNRLDPFNFSGRSSFTVVVQAPTPERAVLFTRALAARIEANPNRFQDFFFRVDPEQVKRWALLYMDQADLLKLRDDISDYTKTIQGLTDKPDLLTFLQVINQEMATRMIGELFTGFLGDLDQPQASEKKRGPMDLSLLINTLEGLQSYLQGANHFKSPWRSLFKNTSWDLDLEGYFWEGDKRYLLAFLIPRKNGDGFANKMDSLALLRSLIGEVRQAFPDVQAGVTGQGALNTDEMATAMRDMDRATLISLFGVMLLMMAFFRSVRRPLAEMITLGVAICWTMGATTLFIGHLNILSVVFAPLLIGLGVDYGIHWYARYEEEEQRVGSKPREVAWRVVEHSGAGIFLAGLSTVFCFLPLILTGFQGLMELGWITGMGIILILLADFTVLPALNVYLSGHKRVTVPHLTENGRNLLQFGPRSAMFVLAAVIALSLVSAWGAAKIRFDLNPLRLQTADAESVIWGKTLIENSRRSLIAAAAFASSPREVEAKAAALKQLPAVSGVQSVFDLLPEAQGEKVEILHSLLPSLPQINTKPIETRPEDLHQLVDLLERIRFKMQEDQAAKWGAEKPLLDQMLALRDRSAAIIALVQQRGNEVLPGMAEYRRLFEEDLIETWNFLRDAASVSPMKIMDLPKFLRDWFYHDGEYLLRIYPKESVWEEDALERFVRQIQSVDPQVAAEPVSLYVFATAYRNACVKAGVYALIVVSILLLVTFRNVRLSLLAMVPLLVGTLWTVGIMGWAGVDFNLANGVFMPLVVGAGVEYGVIILNRWREGSMPPGCLPMSTGKGVILAALTTTLGFGTLMISHHHGIFSLGFISWAGSLCVLVSALVILPAVLALVCRRREKCT
jgi:uncharacterized protein